MSGELQMTIIYLLAAKVHAQELGNNSWSEDNPSLRLTGNSDNF